jgi:hypothetical protein
MSDWRYLLHPGEQVTHACDMHDQRMVGGASLGFEDALHSGGLIGARAQAVHGLRRERDEASLAEQARRFLKVVSGQHRAGSMEMSRS